MTIDEEITVSSKAYLGSDVYIDSLENRDNFMKFDLEIWNLYEMLAAEFGWRFEYIPYSLLKPGFASSSERNYITATEASIDDSFSEFATNFIEGMPLEILNIIMDYENNEEKLVEFDMSHEKISLIKRGLCDFGASSMEKLLTANSASKLANMLESALSSMPRDNLLEEIDIRKWYQESKYWEKEVILEDREKRWCGDRYIIIDKIKDGTETIFYASYQASGEESKDDESVEQNRISKPHLRDYIALLRTGAIRFVI